LKGHRHWPEIYQELDLITSRSTKKKGINVKST
jgi:hypothetical protein